MNWYKIAKDRNINIGVIGFSTQKFDEKLASKKIKEAFDKIKKDYEGNFIVVSGLTNLGIPKLAYKEAVKRKWKTVGVACKKANEFELFDVDEKLIVGEEWGDESEKFLSMLDVLVKVGGGEQSKKEAKTAKENGLEVLEYSL